MTNNLEPCQSNYDWSEGGRRLIGLLIRGTIHYNSKHGLKPGSFREFEDATGKSVSHTTIRAYANATVQNPQQRNSHEPPLAVIAPHLYRFSGVEGETLFFDPSQKYSNWIQLANDLASWRDSTSLFVPKAFEAAATGSTQLSIRRVERAEDLSLDAQSVAVIVDLVLKRLLPGYDSRSSHVPPPSPLLSFLLDEWLPAAAEDQLSFLEIHHGDEPAVKQEKIRRAMLEKARFEPSGADELLAGRVSPSRADIIKLSFLFSQPSDSAPYSEEFWQQKLAIDRQAVASG